MAGGFFAVDFTGWGFGLASGAVFFAVGLAAVDGATFIVLVGGLFTGWSLDWVPLSAAGF